MALLPRHVYAAVAPSSVAAGLRELAELTAEYCARDADLPLVDSLSVRWFREVDGARAFAEPSGVVHADDEPVTGFTNPRERGVVWVNADASPREIVGTVAHEARHQCDYRLMSIRPGEKPTYHQRLRLEDNARSYERVVAAEIDRTGSGGKPRPVRKGSGTTWAEACAPR